MASDELSYCEGYEQVIRKGLALSNFEAYAYAYAYASKIHIGQVGATPWASLSSGDLGGFSLLWFR